MNGPHDMGGTQSVAALVPERDEPVFHAEWERRAFAVTVAMGATGTWNLDMARSARESLPPAQYLASSYYRIWFEALQKLLLAKGLVAADEIRDGKATQAPAANVRTLAADRVASAMAKGSPTQREAAAAARFEVGDSVRTRNMHPATHTRLPRYCRGRRGEVVAVRGVHVFPDTHALGLGEQPQWLYTIEFAATELWGPDTTASSVCVDCWESYLQPPA
jgi:nitrile hydratase beta subunit